MKTVQDAQKEHRKPRNQREIQPQKMIQGKIAAEQFKHMKTLKISKDPLMILKETDGCWEDENLPWPFPCTGTAGLPLLAAEGC